MTDDMAIQGYKRGHLVIWDENPQNQCWRFADNGEQFHDGRPCPQCQGLPHEDGRDACFAEPLPGAAGACCGHGQHIGYVNWTSIPAPPGWWRAAYVGDGGSRGGN